MLEQFLKGLCQLYSFSQLLTSMVDQLKTRNNIRRCTMIDVHMRLPDVKRATVRRAIGELKYEIAQIRKSDMDKLFSIICEATGQRALMIRDDMVSIQVVKEAEFLQEEFKKQQQEVKTDV